MTESNILHLIAKNSEAMHDIKLKRDIWSWSFAAVIVGSVLLVVCWIQTTEPTMMSFTKPCVILAIVAWVNWWAWTMVLLFSLLSNQKIEVQLILEIGKDIQGIRKSILIFWKDSDEITGKMED